MTFIILKQKTESLTNLHNNLCSNWPSAWTEARNLLYHSLITYKTLVKQSPLSTSQTQFTGDMRTLTVKLLQHIGLSYYLHISDVDTSRSLSAHIVVLTAFW